VRRRAAAFLVWASVVLAAALAALGYRWLERRGEFELRRVLVYGCRPADSAEVASAVEGCFGRSLGKIDPEQVAEALEGLRGFESAAVWRSWPDAICAEISIARPVLVLRSGSWASPVSDRGENLPASFLSDTLPVFDLQGMPDPSVLRSAVAWAARGGVPEDAAALTIQGDCISAFMEGHVLLLGAGDYEERLAVYRRVYGAGLIGTGWDVIDLRYEGQTVLRRSDQGVSS